MDIETRLQSDLLMGSIVLGASLIIAGLLIGTPWRVGKDDMRSLTVTGIAKEEVVADSAKWSFTFTRDVNESGLRDGYQLMAKDEAAVRGFLQQAGIAEDDIDILPVSVETVYGQNGPVAEELTLRQSVTVKSADTTALTTLSSQIQPLLASGLIVTAQNLEYLYSKLDEKQGEVLGRAVANAEAVATNLSLGGGRSVGALQSATVKLVQLSAAGSPTTGDYAFIDTSTIDKELRVIVEATFRIE